ncbi:organic hydroperoxide resistance protein [Mycolicibacterium goodii]|uniref:Organic hydroperoxide resistance protein n=1 Tax=Mycolicibacterium goodii TaxID=134601 RepID=A0ABS6HMY7_MYCGD|nr:organic hydroperoxide resistance protein [Mycolicibacterium goodii]OKH74366.1 peroxiredoxin [Mycobacterium sp. SWH-M5]MBU8808336.1 organic hydroperoxide resistance protein [Mycolicibacterium goodii]MBU8814651.1 organic hydroperoxide resistance protein [Mycolicibacterium goodii]MBU8822920.1 organic hydroperoxide resistance protein [Mycolicibacterium goodii]MBU8829248.1 organic hydroperoxide resistance protein [Mycolicibacterium goodii]
MTTSTGNSTDNVIYTAKTHTTGGRQGESYSSDGNLDIQLTPPGANGSGTNPEQLFAAGWSACFLSAMGLTASKHNVKLPADTAVDTEVDLINADGAFSLRARLNVTIPGVDRATAQAIVDDAHQVCPYSKATRGNIDVAVTVA